MITDKPDIHDVQPRKALGLSEGVARVKSGTLYRRFPGIDVLKRLALFDCAGVQGVTAEVFLAHGVDRAVEGVLNADIAGGKYRDSATSFVLTRPPVVGVSSPGVAWPALSLTHKTGADRGASLTRVCASAWVVFCPHVRASRCFELAAEIRPEVVVFGVDEDAEDGAVDVWERVADSIAWYLARPCAVSRVPPPAVSADLPGWESENGVEDSNGLERLAV